MSLKPSVTIKKEGKIILTELIIILLWSLSVWINRNIVVNIILSDAGAEKWLAEMWHIVYISGAILMNVVRIIKRIINGLRF